MMKMTGNTMLITGGGSGIGRALARAFAARGNTVWIAGRRPEALEQTAQGHAHIRCVPLDVADERSVKRCVRILMDEAPTLNVLFNNAGIMRKESWAPQKLDVSVAEAHIATNLLGPVRMTAALLPLLSAQPHATIVNVTSGLAFVPLAMTPTYCATKAALHSLSVSWRYQWRARPLEVVELVPPYTATDLMDGRDDPAAMPLAHYIEEVLHLFEQQPTPPEICVQNVLRLRQAESQGQFDSVLVGLNQAREAAR